MTTQFMRNYIDLINEMQQPQPQQLDEGMMDAIKKAANYVVSNFGPDVILVLLCKIPSDEIAIFNNSSAFPFLWA